MRIAVTVGVLGAVQAAAILIYLAVKRSREIAPSPTFAAQTLTDREPASAITGQRSDGAVVTLTWPAHRTRIVHFWATWCAPCVKELPSLLAFAREMRDQGIDVVAIAVADDWKDIAAFFRGAIPSEVIVETDGAAHKRFGVSTVPDTYLVDPTGRVVERYHGARDWQAPTARAHILATMK